MLCMTKANVERTAQDMSEAHTCRAVRPVPASCWPEGSRSSVQAPKCHGPLYLRGHFSPHPIIL